MAVCITQEAENCTMLETAVASASVAIEEEILFQARGLELPDGGQLKQQGNLRVYLETNSLFQRVRGNYLAMHTYQTYDFMQQQMKKWCNFNHVQLTVMQALDLLHKFVDESDPDVDVPNLLHAFQTAERIRQLHPDKDWFQLTGLIHDLGKILAVWGEPQWAVVGDTFPLGCRFSDKIVFGTESFLLNHDLHHDVYSSSLGVYEPNCGLDKVFMAWGHDEYMYRVLKNHATCTLPEEALYMIRFHSFYPWHKDGEYMHLCSSKDLDMLPWVRLFNSFDLYSKVDEVPDVEMLKPYYQSLIDKYLPGAIRF